MSWAVAFAVAIAGGVALGAVPSRSVPTDQPVTVHGLLTYTWHSDPARGCAAAGVCGDHGSVIVHFDGFGDLTVGKRSDSGFLSGASATARVRRDDPGANPGECVDAISVDSIGVELRRVSGARYVARIDATPVSAGRCAGPLGSELSNVRLPARRLPGRLTGFDLHGATSFAGGPFSGRLTSTVRLVPERSEQQGFTGGSSTSFAPPPTHPHRVRHILVEFVNARYRITGALGTMTDMLSGAPQPYCVPLDDCGVTGSLALTVAGARSGLLISASRVVKRPVGRRQAITDLRAGVLDDVVPPTVTAVRARVAEQLVQAGVGSCLDTVASRPNLSIAGPELFRSGQSIPAKLIAPFDGSDPLRTHCPGPSGADITGSTNGFDPFGQAPIGKGSISLSELGSPQIPLLLSDPGPFSGTGYSGTRSGSLGFTLRLTLLSAGTRHETVPG